ncbi:hypothetical protein NJ7G_0157 [Natrinema sp. J7-2]|nr:hypothetical protein NJ7G_0157 [Natrinema sp. J7-2]
MIQHCKAIGKRSHKLATGGGYRSALGSRDAPVGGVIGLVRLPSADRARLRRALCSL